MFNGPSGFQQWRLPRGKSLDLKGRGGHGSGVLLLTLNRFTHCSGVSIVGFEQLNAGWVVIYRPENFFCAVKPAEVFSLNTGEWIYLLGLSSARNTVEYPFSPMKSLSRPQEPHRIAL